MSLPPAGPSRVVAEATQTRSGTFSGTVRFGAREPHSGDDQPETRPHLGRGRRRLSIDWKAWHLDLTTGEVVGRLKKDWTADVKSYDDGHAHMLMFADVLTDGIVKQFPDKFRS